MRGADTRIRRLEESRELVTFAVENPTCKLRERAGNNKTPVVKYEHDSDEFLKDRVRAFLVQYSRPKKTCESRAQ
jgi:hypothetical protein